MMTFIEHMHYKITGQLPYRYTCEKVDAKCNTCGKVSTHDYCSVNNLTRKCPYCGNQASVLMYFNAKNLKQQ